MNKEQIVDFVHRHHGRASVVFVEPAGPDSVCLKAGNSVMYADMAITRRIDT